MVSSLGNCPSGVSGIESIGIAENSASAGSSLPDPGVPTGSRLQEIALRAEGVNRDEPQ